jgi:carboxymethylenebutenolidase
MATQRLDRIPSTDGDTFTGHVVLPPTRSGPGVLLLQEIFGVNDFVLGKAEALADLGYVVCCPDVFWRVERDVALGHDDEALTRGLELGGRFGSEVDGDVTVSDLTAALEHLRGLPETTGRLGVLGYCLGGTLAYLVATAAPVDACVSYYGSGVPGALDRADRLSCPTLFHFGGRDDYVPAADAEAVAAAFSGRDDVVVRVEPDAGHAFENLLSPHFANPDAASRSWPVTTDFLARWLQRG